ncbi:hypothetical protein DPEC_G00162450 [Dallia pectoralis]|uniref:Uncharacterized protein n=1 Tax=Dallia pectoralis TaxID=75939 RepID=A0ACC2GGA2_DALPE|nr:hypothetical protein DPEC_G00162450 [Dallia pectoralis]
MLGSIVLLGIGVCLLYFIFRNKRPKNFPPGPQPMPVFGNLLQLNLRNPLKDLEKEALVNKGVDFAGRPQNLMINHVLQERSFIFSDYGSKWKEQRRFALMTLRNFGLGKLSMEGGY